MYVFIQIYPGRVVSIDWTVINNSQRDYPANQTRNTIGTSIFRQDLKQNYQINEFHSAYKSLMWNRWMDEREFQTIQI